MAPKSVAFERLAGLDLRDDPSEATGAIDLLDVEFDYQGRLRSREGWTQFIATLGGTTWQRLTGFVSSSGARQIVVGRHTSGTGGTLTAFDSSGAVILSQALAANEQVVSFLRMGGASETLYIGVATNGVSPAANYYTWNGAAFSPIVGNLGLATAQTTDFRLAKGSLDTVAFSDAGAPTTFGVNNFVDLSKNDGEDIVAMQTWANLTFVFKQTKFFVFYGNSIDGSGNPIFNYRTVDNGVGMNAVSNAGVASAPEGLYFVGNDGIYLTTGGSPTLITKALSSLWDGRLAPTYQGFAVDTTAAQVLEWMEGKLYFSFKELTSGTRKMLVFDLKTGNATIWSIAAVDLVAFNLQGSTGRNRLYFITANSTVGLQGQGVTTDNGSAISARYRMPFWRPGAPVAESWVREVVLEGYGTVTVKTAINDLVTLGTGQAVTLGTSPAIAQGRDRRGLRARNVSYEFSGTAPWQLSQVAPIIWGQRLAGEQAA